MDTGYDYFLLWCSPEAGEGGAGAAAVAVAAALVGGEDLGVCEAAQRRVQRGEVVPHDEGDRVQRVGVPAGWTVRRLQQRRMGRKLTDGGLLRYRK